MLHLRKALCLLLFSLLLVQPVFAETEAPATTQPPQPDIVSAVRHVSELPTNWSPLSPSTAEQRWLRSLTTTSLYTLNEDGSWLPVLARELPEDVTASYAGSYGIPADARGGYAFRILLSSDACWEDGLLITADDYIFSIQKLLEDEENRENWTFLANAEAVLSGKKHPGDEIVSLWDMDITCVHDALTAGYTDFFVDTSRFWGLDAGWKPISDRSGLQDFAMPSGMDERVVSAAYLYDRYLSDGAEYSRLQRNFIGIYRFLGKEMTMGDLGILKVGPFELILLVTNPIAPSTLIQKLENLFLFRQSCWGKDFATSPETYCGYGPYRITSVDSRQIILEPNANWWGAPVSEEFDRIICRQTGKD